MINNNKTIASKYFEYRTKLIGSTPNDNNTLDTEVAVPLKYLNNFWKSLDLLLIYCEAGLDLLWSKECIISELSVTPRVPPNPDAYPPVQEVALIQKTTATFQIINVKLYVPVVTLSINNNITFLKNIKQQFKRTIPWNKYRSKITMQPKTII